MTTTQPPPPAPFTNEDYAARMRRVRRRRRRAGLDGLLVTPGPDLVWLTGYQPTAITERLTVLVLTPDREPTLLVPTLERPDAEAAVGAPSLAIVDWADGEDPFARAAALLRAGATMGDLGLGLGHAPARPAGRRARHRSYRSLTQSLPMLRAVKDADELARLAAAGAAADATYEQILGVRFAGRKETDVAADLAGCCGSSGTSRSTSPSSAPGPTAPTRTTRPATGPSRSATRSCSTSAA